MVCLLIKNNKIVDAAPIIEFGIFDESFEKWRLADENNSIMYYMIDNQFTLVENVELPSDYEYDKYFYENGEFVLNEEWKPYVSSEQRIETLEETVSIQAEQLIATDEVTIGLYEAQIAQEEINFVHDESIIELYELYGSLQL